MTLPRQPDAAPCLDEIGQALANDEDAGAKVLCAYRGDWAWEKITEKARDRYRYEAREIAEAFNDKTTDMHMPMLHGFGIGMQRGAHMWLETPEGQR